MKNANDIFIYFYSVCLELVSDLSTAIFLAALRFIGHRFVDVETFIVNAEQTLL